MAETGDVQVANQNGSAEGQDQQQQQPAGRSWLDIAKSFMFQMVIFYFITSYFRGNKTPPPDTTGPDGKPLPSVGTNLFSKGQELVSKDKLICTTHKYVRLLPLRSTCLIIILGSISCNSEKEKLHDF